MKLVVTSEELKEDLDTEIQYRVMAIVELLATPHNVFVEFDLVTMTASLEVGFAGQQTSMKLGRAVKRLLEKSKSLIESDESLETALLGHIEQLMSRMAMEPPPPGETGYELIEKILIGRVLPRLGEFLTKLDRKRHEVMFSTNLEDFILCSTGLPFTSC